MMNDYRLLLNNEMTLETFKSKYPKVNMEELDTVYRSQVLFKHIAEMHQARHLSPRQENKLNEFLAFFMARLTTGGKSVQFTEYGEKSIVRIPEGRLIYNKEKPYRIYRIYITQKPTQWEVK